LSLEELNLSGNSCGQAGSMALESWINNVKSYGKLKRLNLSQTNFNIAFTPSMKLLPYLEELDISGNKVDQGEGCVALAWVCEFSHALKNLNICKTGLTKDSMEPVLEAL